MRSFSSGRSMSESDWKYGLTRISCAPREPSSFSNGIASSTLNLPIAVRSDAKLLQRQVDVRKRLEIRLDQDLLRAAGAVKLLERNRFFDLELADRGPI